ncbi:MAG: hypothetical protein C6I00_06500 [Nitratiruptor sp.]|nr:hypothetical protein [Nitratiruptor sp.]
MGARSQSLWQDSSLREVTIQLEGKTYRFELPDEFAHYMEQELGRSLDRHSNNSAKRLLNAYLKKCYECFMKERELEELKKNCKGD